MNNLSTAQLLTIILGFIAITKTGIELYRGIINPNVKQDLRLQGLENSDSAIKKDVGRIEKNLEFIKENHLKHIERDINDISKKMARLEVIIENKIKE